MKLKDIEGVYQLPKESPKGVLFVAHGCSHSATDWWSRDDNICRQCTGLPVERSIVKEAVLSYGFAVIAISSFDRDSKCWSGKDAPRVIKMLKHFYENVLRIDLQSQQNIPTTAQLIIPLYMLGASSGGSFVGLLSQHNGLRPRPSAICVQISTMNVYGDVPPVAFVLMNRDERTRYFVKERVLPILNKSTLILTSEQRIDKSYFRDHSHGAISAEDSQKIYQALLSSGMINSQSGLLMQDPRASDWRTV